MRIAGLLLYLLSLGALAANQADQVFARVSPAVVTVLALGPAGQVESMGSGVVIAPGRVATNCHVVRDAKTLKVRQGDATLGARWVLGDQGRDLCLLDVAGLRAPAVEVRESTGLAIGERVFAVGNPLGFGLAVSEGLLAHAARPASGDVRLFITAAVSPGSSGGGLFDDKGRLIGIVTASMSLGQNFNVALPAEWIAQVSRSGKAPPAAMAIPGAEPAWLAEAEKLALARNWPELEAWAKNWRDAMPGTAEPYRYLGLSLLRQSRAQAAIAPLRGALERHPCHVQALVHLAGALHANGDRDEADKTLARAMQCSPAAGLPYGEMARLRAGDGRLEEAEQAIRKALLLLPFDTWNWWMFGQIRERRLDQAGAARAYQVAVRQDPENAGYQADLARALAASGKGGQARQVMAQLPTGAANSARTWLQVGVRDLQQNRLSDAEFAARKALEIDAGSVEGMVLLGIVLAQTGREQEAADTWHKALAIRPNDPEVLIKLAELRIKQREFSAAGDLLKRVLSQKPVPPQALRLSGAVRFEQRDFVGAVEAYQQLTRSDNATAADWRGLAKSLISINRLPEGEKALREAERLAPEDVDTLFTLSTLYGRQGNSQQALAYVEKVLAKDASLGLAWSSKGYALLTLGRLDEAVSALETAVRLQPNLANGWINLGQAMMAKKQFGNAIVALEKATQLSPRAADARLYLAQAYAQGNLFDKSRAQLQVHRELHPDSIPGYALAISLDLAQGRQAEALDAYQQMKARNPAAAAQFRSLSISRGFPGAASLPE